ncbi:TetR/AcrR family transcriptional regulator [Solwaraspora sp. WMMD792]|uniref:TetR/AcrR family transcriptional regulator n=1 Tax=Solwaraspora sp. WMMD792 TaxID=3016099 RepID=UPI00241789C1|nr:TetR/AcrR family transcriptional regulator [Solwaraspora sp. WMMD792]MDG4769502.1 TetR/AcrR family transcriptional regulator [Solwaraspora sp. WMMD792]
MAAGATRRTYHHGALRDALLAGARELLAERGAEGFSLNELARRVGVSSAAPYRHFTDREALLSALRDEGYDAFGAAQRAAAAQATDPADRIIRLVAAYLRFAEENSAIFGMMFRYWSWAEVRPDTFAPLVDAVTEAQEASFLPAGQSATALARTIWCTVHGLTTLRLTGGLKKLGLDAPSDQLIRDTFAAILRDPAG